MSPAPERGGRARSQADGRAAPETTADFAPGRRPGDVPASFARRYLTESLRGGAAVAFFEGPGAKRAAFHDHGSRLETDQSHPALARDLAAVAAHRGWRAVQVRGSDEFRREVWLEARALGLQVKGYKARERDDQELEQRRAASARRRPAAQPPRSQEAPAPKRDAPDREAGVSGRLVAEGQAPYRRRPGAPLTPFIRLDRGEGRTLDIWGAGLTEALRTSGARVGDAVQVRRDGVDVVQRTVEVRDRRTGRTPPERREVDRARWTAQAERFLKASPGEAARDTEFAGAQSHLAVLNVVIDRAVSDPALRERLRTEARALVADELAEGRAFTPARIREVEPGLARDVVQAREASLERAHRR